MTRFFAAPLFAVPLFAALLAIGSAAAARPEPRTYLDRTMPVPGSAAEVHVEMRTVTVRASGEGPRATAGYLSYTVPSQDGDRPVVFAFNGGPGVSSAFLQIGALGPWRSNLPSDPRAVPPEVPGLVAGSNGLLPSADLVFIDPPGTGFSELPERDAASFAGVANDAAAVADLIAGWLDGHGRRDAPVYIVGESYGTIRAVALLDALAMGDAPAKVRGVILLGQALNMIETSQRPDNVVSHVLALPTLAALACHHRIVEPTCDVEQAIADAEVFGRTTYLAALFAGRDLPDAERASVAGKLASLTGIAADWFLEHDLAVPKELFREMALAGRGEIMGRYDGRYVSPLPDDPARIVATDPSSALVSFYGKTYLRQLSARFGLAEADRYRIVAYPKADWPYGGGDTPFADWPFMSVIERHAGQDRCLRVFVGTGIYDLTTTIGAADYLFARSSLPRDRYENRRYEGGHMFYSDGGARARLIADLASFIDSDPCR